MSWADRSRPSPILTGLFPPSPSRPEGPGNSLRWHFTQAQKLLVVLLAISLAYLAYTLYSDEVLHIRDFSLHAGPHKHDPAQPITKTHAPDKDDINPTMPSNIRKALVLSSFKDQNNDWLLRLQNVSPRWEIYRYVADDDDTKALKLEGKLGREALAYLTFIIDNFDNLPDYTIFNHGHDRAWHQPMTLFDKIVSLNYSALDDEHYINLRCTESPGCTSDTKYYFDHPKEGDDRWGYRIEKFWNNVMRPQIGRMPRIIGCRCCAQFAVDKAAILHRPLIFYERLRDPLVNLNMTGIGRIWGEDLPEMRIGTMFELTWHIIFGKPANHCPSRDHCNQVYFQNKIHCDREVHTFRTSDGWEDIKCTNDLIKGHEWDN